MTVLLNKKATNVLVTGFLFFIALSLSLSFYLFQKKMQGQDWARFLRRALKLSAGDMARKKCTLRHTHGRRPLTEGGSDFIRALERTINFGVGQYLDTLKNWNDPPNAFPLYSYGEGWESSGDDDDDKRPDRYTVMTSRIAELERQPMEFMHIPVVPDIYTERETASIRWALRTCDPVYVQYILATTRYGDEVTKIVGGGQSDREIEHALYKLFDVDSYKDRTPITTVLSEFVEKMQGVDEDKKRAFITTDNPDVRNAASDLYEACERIKKSRSAASNPDIDLDAEHARKQLAEAVLCSALGYDYVPSGSDAEEDDAAGDYSSQIF